MKTLVKDAYLLYELMNKKYEGRFKCDPFIAMMGKIEGTFDNVKLMISFKGDEYLILSVENDEDDIIGELIPFLKEVMGGEQALCKYDLLCDNELMPTIEWDVLNPDERLRNLVNGRGYNNSSVLNLNLFNRNINDYIESEKDKEDRIKNARIYGIDPGSIKDPESIKNLSELDLFFNIDVLGRHIWYCEHEMSHGRIEKVDLTEERYALEYLVYQTKKFGVELSEPEIDKHITATPSYNAWYKFFKNHFENVLTDEEWNDFMKLRKAGGDVSKYMPQGNWRDLIESPMKKELKNN